MPGTALLAIQAAIFGVLSADVTLTGLCAVVGDIADDVPYPFAFVGTATEVPWETMGGPSVGLGADCRVTCHIYSRYAGDSEALTILDRVMALLHHAALTVTGYGSVCCELDDTRVLLEYPQKVEQRHIAARFRVRVHV
jgi:hypothetical protein